MAKKPLTFKSEDDFRAFKEDIAEARAEEAKKTKVIHIRGLDQKTAKKTSPEQKAVKAGQSVHEALESLRKAIIENWDYLRLDFIDSKAEFDFLASAPDYITELEPFLIILVEKNSDFTIVDFYHQCFTDDWEIKEDCPYLDIIERAKADKAAFEAAKNSKFNMLQLFAEDENKITTAKAKNITVKPTEKVDFPLDKPNREIWDLLLSDLKYNNQLQLATVTIDTSKGKKKREVGIIYGISIDKLKEVAPNLKITKPLTQYDKRVYIAASAIYNAGNEVTTATQIYNAMGNKGNPSTKEIKKINDSLTKMSAARVYLNNTHEAEKYSRYPVFRYDGDLLPFERSTEIINGQETESAIHFFREPPLMTFAKERKQITTFDLRVLESPINKTEPNLAIDDYLIERISHIKQGNANPKILYVTLYEKCRITTKMQKTRAPEKIRRYLEHYKSCKFIYDYKEESDGIYIFVSKAAKGKKS